MSDELDVRRRRAAFRAVHRGSKEMDALIGRYAQARLAQFNDETLGHFERFLSVADPTLQAWILGEDDAGAAEFAALIGDIRAFHGLNARSTAAR